MFFYLVLTPISTTSGIWSAGNTRKYHQIDVYIYQCELTKHTQGSSIRITIGESMSWMQPTTKSFF